jgi:hypothetical protein
MALEAGELLFSNITTTRDRRILYSSLRISESSSWKSIERVKKKQTRDIDLQSAGQRSLEYVQAYRPPPLWLRSQEEPW